MSDEEKESFLSAIEQDTKLRKEFIRQKNLWAVSTSLGQGNAQKHDADYFLYKLNAKKNEAFTIQRLSGRLAAFKVAAAVLFLALIGSVAKLTMLHLAGNETPVFYTETYVPKGEKSELTLPDGTHLYINADTRVEVPSTFSETNRRLKIDGQAYFEVKHNSDSPFLVETESVNIEVLGTSFDVSCYKDDEMVTTMLDEGKIRFVGANNNKVNGTFLKPGETAYYHKSSGVFKIKATDKGHNQAAWKEGKLKFKDMPFHVLAAKIERLYNVEITMDDALKFQRYTGEIDDETVREVMNNFAIATPFDVEFSGRKIYVKSKKNYQ